MLICGGMDATGELTDCALAQQSYTTRLGAGPFKELRKFHLCQKHVHHITKTRRVLLVEYVTKTET